MSPSLFNRDRSDDETSEVPEQATQDPEVEPIPVFREVALQWRKDLATQIRSEMADNPVTRLNFDSAHPGGLAQLYAERPTKLSSLIREESTLDEATETAREMLEQIRELKRAHGSAVTHLAIGAASWEEEGRKRTTPILLRPVEMGVEEDGEITVTVRPGIEISNRLLDLLARQGTPLDSAELIDLARTRHGFSPVPVLDAIKKAGVAVPGLVLRDGLTLGTFVHPTSALLRELGAPHWLSLSPVTRALAGDQAAKQSLDVALPEPNPRDRDPWEEKGIGDQPPATQDVIEASLRDASLAIDVSSGVDAVRTAASVAVAHAVAGNKVLVVAGSTEMQREVLALMEAEGASGVAASIEATTESADQVQKTLKGALLDASDNVDFDALDELRSRLRAARESLSSYTDSLHQVFPQWGVSAFDALQVLTDLTSIPGGPETHVRLSFETLAALSSDEGDQGRDLLERASALGVFRNADRQTWWGNVEIDDPAKVQVALDALERLSQDSLPSVRVQMVSVAGQSGLSTPNSLAEWNKQLEMLDGVRKSLDVFLPEVFERSAADMVSATASKQWRKDRGINMRGSQRRNLVKQAKDYVLPGRYVEDLHEELVLVQKRREEWRKYTEDETWPRLPVGLDGLITSAQKIDEDLQVLAPFLSGAYGDLSLMDIGELNALTENMLADSADARTLPERVAVMRQIEAIGLGDFIADMQARNVDGEDLFLELDLAWWASALGLMLAAEPRLGGFDPSRLQSALVEERLLDQAQVASLGPVARSKILKQRARALAIGSDVYIEASRAYNAPGTAASYYARIPLSWSLVPIVLTTPALVPYVVPWGNHVDVVILVGTENISTASLVPVIARGRQVVVVSRADKGSEESSAAQLREVLPVMKLPTEPQQINDSVVRLLAKYEGDASGVPVPARRARGRVEVTRVEGTGMPAPGESAIDTSTAEVDMVIAKIRQHLLEEPNESLAVIALNSRHAGRIEGALRRARRNDPELDAALDEERSEPFAVVAAEDVVDLRRDRIILAVGYAKTPHGRVIHDFGPYSQPEGEKLLSAVLRSVRGDLVIVTALTAEEIIPERLRHPGSKMLVDLIAMGGDSVDTPDWPTVDLAPDRLLVDLAERLYRLGLNVVPNLGVSGGMRIPLAIGHPEVPSELLVAVLTDDDAYLSEPSQRVKDRLWPSLLEEQGWKVRIELSMAVFIDPNREAEAIVQLVLDAVDEFYERNPELAPPEMLEETAVEAEVESESEVEPEEPVQPQAPAPRPKRGPRPPIAKGLPLAAYSDDQLDEMALWILQGEGQFTDEELVEELRDALGMVRRGAQSSAVLSNVVRRTRASLNADG